MVQMFRAVKCDSKRSQSDWQVGNATNEQFSYIRIFHIISLCYSNNRIIRCILDWQEEYANRKRARIEHDKKVAEKQASLLCPPYMLFCDLIQGYPSALRHRFYVTNYILGGAVTVCEVANFF